MARLRVFNILIRTKAVLILLWYLFFLRDSVYGQNLSSPKMVKQGVRVSSSKSLGNKLPKGILVALTDSVDAMVINDATAFRHIDLPKKFIPSFNSYIIDSAISEISGCKSLVYYNYTLKNGQIINGDIYWKESDGYIVFKIGGRVYTNYFSQEGVAQLKKLFKL